MSYVCVLIAMEKERIPAASGDTLSPLLPSSPGGPWGPGRPCGPCAPVAPVAPSRPMGPNGPRAPERYINDTLRYKHVHVHGIICHSIHVLRDLRHVHKDCYGAHNYVAITCIMFLHKHH